MTDRELIELAAKAAGIEYDEDIYADGLYTKAGFWNPLTSDADAFRMAVRLEISVSQFHSSVTADAFRLPVRAMTERVTIASERQEATRRAITRAAAEIAEERTS